MILFITLLTLLIFSLALAPIIVNNAVYAVLCFIVVFLLISGVLLSLGIEFLAFVYAIVYIGAVAVLFLFVVMLLQVSSQYKRELKSYWIVLLMLCVVTITVKIVKILVQTISIPSTFLHTDIILPNSRNLLIIDTKVNNSWLPSNELYLISSKLYNTLSTLFLETAFILLLALIAVIILTKVTMKHNI